MKITCGCLRVLDCEDTAHCAYCKRTYKRTEDGHREIRAPRKGDPVEDGYYEACADPFCDLLAIGPGCVVAAPKTENTPGSKYCFTCSKKHATPSAFSGSGVRVIRKTGGLT